MRLSKYGVEIELLNQFLRDLPPFDPKNLVYVDEIGQMQLCSELFKQLVYGLLDTAKLYVSTLQYRSDDEFIATVRARDDVVVLCVTPENRELLQRVLSGVAEGSQAFMAMDDVMRREITRLARQSVQVGNYTQLRKLFRNAVKYIASGAVQKVSGGYTVAGNHGNHFVTLQAGRCACDCDLFNDRREFIGQAGECSHIQAVAIIEAVFDKMQ